MTTDIAFTSPALRRQPPARLEPCIWPGCPEIVSTRCPKRNHTYCPAHQAIAMKAARRRAYERWIERKAGRVRGEDWHCTPSACTYFRRCQVAVLRLDRLPCESEHTLASREPGDYAVVYAADVIVR